MRYDVVLAGLGGQGLMTMGQILATAAMREGRNVSYLPSYSPEVRGGWANCTVVVSDDAVGSPTVGQPSALVAMEATAAETHLPTVRPGGLVLVNSTLVRSPLAREDVRLRQIPASEIAAGLGDDRAANSVMLGAYVTASGIVPLAIVEAAIREQLQKRPKLVDLNVKALRAGAAFIEGAQQPAAALGESKGTAP
jgi:2-oxoglutarate ferredoxin oxidoreductase subunit gamma